MEVYRRLPGEIYRSNQLSVTLSDCDSCSDSEIETSSVKSFRKQLEIPQTDPINERSKIPVTSSKVADTDNKIKRGWIFSTDLIDGLEPEKVSKIAAKNDPR